MASTRSVYGLALARPFRQASSASLKLQHRGHRGGKSKQTSYKNPAIWSIPAITLTGSITYQSTVEKKGDQPIVVASSSHAETGEMQALSTITDRALVGLIPQSELEAYKENHDRLEEWFNRSRSVPKRFQSKCVEAITDMAVVPPEFFKEYIASQIGAFLEASVISEASRKKLSSDLTQAAYIQMKYDTFHRIDLDADNGGTRVLENFVFMSTKLDNGSIAIFVSYFGESKTLVEDRFYRVENHDCDKIKKWLDWKLCQNIFAKRASLEDMKDPVTRNWSSVLK